MTHLQRLDQLARTLKPAALRILLYYTATGQRTFQASEREIARDVGISSSSTYEALQELASKCLITKRAGTTTKASRYDLCFWDTVEFPTPASVSAKGASISETPPVSNSETPCLDFRGAGISISETPPAENAGDATLGSRVRSEDSLQLEAVVDRIRRARPKHFSPDLIAAARARLHGYMKHFGPERLCHPPDELTVAQFLALGNGVGEWPALDALLNSLFRERQPIREVKYGWFHTVAMQRLHGVSPHLQKQQRQLRVVGKFHAPGATVDAELQQLDLGLHQLAQTKRMR